MRPNDSIPIIKCLLCALLVAIAASAALGISQALAMQINIDVVADGTPLPLDVEPGDTIDQVKAKIQEAIGTPPDQQVLIFGTTFLEDGRTLADYNIKRDATLQMFLGASVITVVDTTQTAIGSTQVLAAFNAGHACTSATLTVFRVDAFPDGTGSAGMLPVYWNITSDCADEFSLDLSLCYTDAQLAAGLNVTESGLVIFKKMDTQTTWTYQGGVADPANNCVSLGGVTELSNWTLYDRTPTVVRLSAFSAAPGARGELLIPMGVLIVLTGGLALRRKPK